MNTTLLPTFAPAIADFSYQALNWVTFAQTLFTTLGILATAIFTAIQHIRQSANDVQTAQIAASQEHLVSRTTELHNKVDSLTPKNTPSASSAEIGSDEIAIKKA